MASSFLTNYTNTPSNKTGMNFQANPQGGAQAKPFGNFQLANPQLTKPILIGENITMDELEKMSRSDKPHEQKFYSAVIGHIVQVYNEINKISERHSELTESYDKKLYEVEEEMQRSISQTLLNLANEIDHAFSLVSYYREDLEYSQFTLNNSVVSRSFLRNIS